MIGTILAPYKATILGGTGLGDESVIPDMVGEQMTKVNNTQFFIYLCDIEKIYTSTNQIIIVKKNQELEKFIFKSEEKMKEYVNMIKRNYKEAYKSVLISHIF
jgi:hypothetical protein